MDNNSQWPFYKRRFISELILNQKLISGTLTNVIQVKTGK